MSKGRRTPDAARTAMMLDLLQRRHAASGMSMRHVVLEEVAPGTGFVGRWADAVVLNMWASDKQSLIGYEVKASRADLKRELADPSKWRAVGKYCDAWHLIAWDEKVIEGLADQCPPEWGILLTRGDDDDRELVVYRKAQKLEPIPRPWDFVCALVRNAFEQRPSAATVGRSAIQAYKEGVKEGQEIAKVDWLHRMDKVRHALYGDLYRRFEFSDDDKFAADLLARLTQPLLGATGT